MNELLVVLLVVGLLLLIAAPTLIWWAGREFWRRSPAGELLGPARYRAVAGLLLLAGTWHLTAYCLTAALLLPWAKGLGHGRSPDAEDWAAAYLRHELLLLALFGLGGALVLLARQRRLAALSWLAGCLLVLGGFRGWRAYSRHREEAKNAALLVPPPYTFADSLGYTKLYQYYPPRLPGDHSLAIRQAMLWDRVEIKPVFPGGEQGLRMAIGRLVHYPWAARGLGLARSLAVSCIVETDGHLTVMDVELPAAAYSPDPAAGLGFEAEAARVVQALPPFLPGRQAGRPVAVARTLTVEILPPLTTSAQ